MDIMTCIRTVELPSKQSKAANECKGMIDIDATMYNFDLGYRNIQNWVEFDTLISIGRNSAVKWM